MTVSQLMGYPRKQYRAMRSAGLTRTASILLTALMVAAYPFANVAMWLGGKGRDDERS